MHHFTLDADQISVGLAALKSAAAANGEFADEERHLIEAAARALEVDVDVDELPLAEPEDVAAVFREPLERQRLLQAMIVMAMIDGEVSPDELALIKRFAKALDVSDPHVHNLEQLMKGHLRRMRIDLARRLPIPRHMAKQVYAREGVLGVMRFARAMIRGSGDPDPEVAWRYKSLGLLPDDTVGRHFWVHMTERRFPLPGEPGGIHEVGVPHDVLHVLTGYDTDPEGETLIASFYAGYNQEDPFAMIFMVLVMFHLGLELAPIATPGKGHFHPDRVIRAMRRGAEMAIDPMRDLDIWAIAQLPLEEARARLNVVPE